MTLEAVGGPTSAVQRWLAIVSALTGTSMFLYSVAVVAIATPYMQGAFSAAPDQIAWLGTSYLVGTIVVMACSGWLSTRFGRKRLFLVSVGGFTLFSMLGGMAGSLEEMVVYRTAQGMFGAPLLPLGQAITIDYFPPRKQGLGTVTFTIGATMGIVVGPVVGATLVEEFHWGWIFFLNGPLGVTSFIGVWAFVRETPKERDRPLDWFGFMALIVALGAAQLALNRGDRLNWFSSTEIIVECAVGALAVYVFIVHSLTTRRPFLEARLFRNWNYVIGLFIATAWGAQIYLPVFLIPLELQSLGGYPITFVGLLITPRGVGNIVGALIIIGLSDRLDPRYLLVAGVGALMVSAWGMSLWTAEIRPWDVVWTGFLQGVGVGVSFVPVSMLTLSTLEVRLRTEGLAVFHLLLNMGAAAGIAVIFFVWTRSLQTSHEILTGHVTHYSEVFRYSFVPQMWDLTERSGLLAVDAEIWRQAGMIAYNNSFYLTAVISALMLPLTFLMRRPRTDDTG